jgi:hypothetical protein
MHVRAPSSIEGSCDVPPTRPGFKASPLISRPKTSPTHRTRHQCCAKPRSPSNSKQAQVGGLVSCAVSQLTRTTNRGPEGQRRTPSTEKVRLFQKISKPSTHRSLVVHKHQVFNRRTIMIPYGSLGSHVPVFYWLWRSKGRPVVVYYCST